jgi:phage gp46-like protein
VLLLTDRYCPPDHPLAYLIEADDPRGWWGDAFADRPIGSKLWLRQRAKQTAQTLALVKDDVTSALQWMVDDKVIAGLDVAAAWLGPGFLGVVVEIFQTDGARLPLNFQSDWQGVN